MSMARLTFPSRLELNRPAGSLNAAPFANVILTTFLYVSPVQTMPPRDQTGVPLHFHSSTISGSTLRIISRTFASVFPRQSPSSPILLSINEEADSTSTAFPTYTSTSRASMLAVLRATPEEVRNPPEHTGSRCPTPGLGAIAHREVRDERRGEVDGEAGPGPFLEPRRHRRENQHHPEELGPREFHPEVAGEAEVDERPGHLRQTQFRVSGEAHLQTEEGGGDPGDDGPGLGGPGGSDERRLRQGRFHWVLSLRLQTSGFGA